MQSLALRCRAIYEVAVFLPLQQEIEQDLALRGQERRIARHVRRQCRNVAGDQSLQEARRIRTRHRQDATPGQDFDGFV